MGLLGGIAGVLIGIILGYLVKELLGQFHSDKEALNYFENPGRPGFYEGEPGLAAFCALGILIAAESPGSSPFPSSGSATGGEAASREVARQAAACFPGNRADPSLVEHFCRLAWSRRHSLNPDLLTESLMARRGSMKDLAALGRGLHDLASGEKALELARSIRAMLDPGYNPQAEMPPPEKDPWKILGLPPGTPVKEVKSRFRRLAIRRHPDSLQGLDEERRERAAEAVIAIQEAYRESVAEAGENDSIGD
jgi:DnaJ like chaperone protein